MNVYSDASSLSQRVGLPIFAKPGVPAFWLGFALPTILILVAAYSMYSHDREMALTALKLEQASSVVIATGELRRDVLRAMSDAAFLSRLPSVQDMTKHPSDQRIQRIAGDFLAFQNSHPNEYFQVRLLSTAGMELIRAEKIGSRIQLVPQALLQSKAGRDYVREGAELPLEGFYLSRFDLNVENGEIEQPLRPTLRLVHRFNSAQGLPLLLVLNIEGSEILRQFTLGGESGWVLPMLIDDQGCRLRPNGSLQDWGCVQQGVTGGSFAAIQPEAWHAIKQGREGLDSGLLVWRDLHSEMLPHLTGLGPSMKMSSDLMVVSHVDESMLDARLGPISKTYSIYTAVALSVLSSGWLMWWLIGLRSQEMLAEKANDAERIENLEGAVSDQALVLQENAQNVASVGVTVAGIVHDLNNLLGIIQGYSDLVAAGLKEESVAARNLRQVGVAVSRGRNLVRQVMMLAAAQDGPESTDVNMLRLLEELIDLLSIRAGDDISIALQAEGIEEAIVWGDATQLHQVFLNLGINAIQAIQHRAGNIRFSVDTQDASPDAIDGKHEQSKPYLRIQVADDGPGMSPDIAKRVFEASFTTRRDSGGNGLGLAVVRSSIERHGGTIDLTTAPGEGACFTVCLPLATSTPNGISQIYDHAAISSRSRVVLVVDDDRQYLEIYAASLMSDDYSVISLDNPWDALKMVLTGGDSIAAVIADYDMPGLDGLGLAERLHQLRPELPVMICTGRQVENLRRIAADQGISGLFTKPVDFERLRDHLREVIRDD